MHGGIFGSKRRTVRRLAACKVPHRAMYPKVHSNGFEKKKVSGFLENMKPAWIYFRVWAKLEYFVLTPR